MSKEDPRARLADDIRRAAGYMEAIVAQAERLDMPVPQAIHTCVAVWRGWFRALDRRREPPD
jgi:hypothetical protein